MSRKLIYLPNYFRLFLVSHFSPLGSSFRLDFEKPQIFGYILSRAMEKNDDGPVLIISSLQMSERISFLPLYHRSHFVFIFHLTSLCRKITGNQSFVIFLAPYLIELFRWFKAEQSDSRVFLLSGWAIFCENLGRNKMFTQLWDRCYVPLGQSACLSWSTLTPQL